jgi:hypothetical protein
MSPMRALILTAAMAAAAPAAAQSLNAFQLDALRADQSAAQLHAIQQDNERMALEARLRASQAVLDLELQRALPPQVSLPPYPGAGAPAQPFDVSKLPSIPDAALAASNKRVRDAVKNPK